MTQQMTRSQRRAPARRAFSPFPELDEIQRTMEELVQSAVSGAAAGEGAAWTPSADIEETEDAWLVEAELPGVRREDLSVELRDSELVISGEIKEREREGILRRRTRRVGRFEYRVTLPGEADADGVDASLDDGVLTLRIPKAERARPKRIEIKSR